MVVLLPKPLLILALYSEILMYALGKATLKVSPVQTSSKFELSGLEKDVDDRADNVIHDPRELGVQTKPRFKRSLSKYVVSDLGDNDREFYTGQGDGDVNTDDTDFAFVEEETDINSGYSPWGSWSECSRTCGIGRKRRERKCLGQQHCTDGDVEVKIFAIASLSKYK